MALILDTDVIIAGEKGALDLVVWLRSRAPEQVEVAAITVAELWHGVERAKGRYRSERERYLRIILSFVPVVPYTEQTAYEHARLWAELETAGKLIGYYDMVVGATALERGSGVATFNARHFRQVRGLKVIEPN
jgi:tRNA(fMet)-specific endonuclease VapC